MSFRYSPAQQSEYRWIHFVAITLALLGVINILSAWISYDTTRIQLAQKLFDHQLIYGSRMLVVIMGVVSLLIAPRLYRRKRVAWYLAIIVLVISALTHFIKGIDVEEASFDVLLIGILLPLYNYCNVLSDPIRLRLCNRLILSTLVFIVFYTFIGVHVFTDRLGIDPSEGTIWNIALRALLFDVTDMHPHGFPARFFVDSLLWINSTSLILGISYALAPVIVRTFPQQAQASAQKLVATFATQPVQPIVTDNTYLMDIVKRQDRSAFIAYRMVNRVAMAIGNPCGDLALRKSFSAWVEKIVRHDWIPAVYQADEKLVAASKELGFKAIPIGEEAVIDLSTFSIQGKAMQDLRSARNKAQREYWTVKEYQESDWSSLKAINAHWITKHGGIENGFAMGKATSDYLAKSRTVLLLDQENQVLAFMNTLPLPGQPGWGVDVMRRSPQAPSGAMEYLFLHEIEQAKAEGMRYFDLGFSALVDLNETEGDNLQVVKLLNRLSDKLSTFYDFKGLHQFKAKFAPNWQTRYLIYPNALELPSVLTSLILLNQGNVPLVKHVILSAKTLLKKSPTQSGAIENTLQTNEG